MRRIVFCLMGLALPGLAAAEGPAEKPMLVLDAGGHTAHVKQVLFTPDAKELITVSNDKSIRFWDAATGEPLRTLRPPAGPGTSGTMEVAALAPDGKTLAVAGNGLRDGRGWVYLIGMPGGEVRRVLKGHANGVTALAFSPDGKRLASASYDRTARVWDVDAGGDPLTLQGHAATVGGVAWSPDGARLATASADKTVRLWSAETGKEQAALKGQEAIVTCVAWSADGATVATGDWGGTIRLWGADGSARRTIDKLGVGLTSVHFCPDSRRLLYTGALGTPDRRVALLDVNGAGRLAFARHQNSVYCGAFSPDGALVATGDATGAILLWKPADGAVVRTMVGGGRQVWAAAWGGKEGQTLYWGNRKKGDSLKAEEALEHAFVLPELRPDTAEGPPARRAVLADGGATVEVAADLFSLTLKRGADKAGEWRAGTNERILCYTFVPGDRLAVGTDYRFLLMDAHTLKPLRTFVGYAAGTWAAAPSPDGRFLLSGSSDQTVRVWTLDRDEPLLSLFSAGNEWIAWTPEGYYAASPGGEQLMGWQVGNGPEKMASFYPASQFRKTLYRPDVIKRLLTAGSLEKALSQADEERGKTGRATEVAQVLPPKVTITSPKAGVRPNKAALRVEAHAVGAENNPVASLRLLLDGRPADGDGPKVFTRPIADDARVTWDVELPPGSHRLVVQATGTASVGLSDELEVTYTPAGQAPDKAGPTGNLYVLAVGINDYPGALKLQCAAPDARLIAQTFKDESKGLFRKVDVRLLTDKDATREGILKGLRWLRESARPGDVAVAFYAGHGDCRLAGRFFLIPVDANLKDLPGTAVSGDELKAGLADLPCSTVLLLDACYSGSIDAKRKKRALPGAADALVRDFAYDAGLVVLCGASKEQEAAEESGHGFFTKAIAEGLSGKAGKDKQGLVTLYKLQDYVHDRVAELSGGEQEPTVSIPSTVRSFPLAKP